MKILYEELHNDIGLKQEKLEGWFSLEMRAR